MAISHKREELIRVEKKFYTILYKNKDGQEENDPLNSEVSHVTMDMQKYARQEWVLVNVPMGEVVNKMTDDDYNDNGHHNTTDDDCIPLCYDSCHI